MNLLQDINDRVAMDPDAAKQFFDLKKKPDAGWLKKIEPGVDAAQRVLDAMPKPQDATPGAGGQQQSGNVEDFGLGAEPRASDPAPDPAPPANESALAALRGRLRVAIDAGVDTCINAVLAGAWSRRVMMLTPLNQPVNPWVHFAHMAQLRTQPWVGYYQETDTIIQVARNKCAHAFLASEAEWSFWVDGDIVPSAGDPSLFYDIRRLGVEQRRIPVDFLKTKTLERLLKHGKTIVGAVYQQRRKRGLICSPADLRPNPTIDEKDAIAALRANGPRDHLLQVDWCATGCLLVHRSVYEDIKKQRPDLAPRQEGAPWNFFGHEVGLGGEDAAFGVLAKKAGHQSYLDLGTWVAHVGNHAYMPEFI